MTGSRLPGWLFHGFAWLLAIALVIYIFLDVLGR
jgi:hypothetical protein